MAKDIVMSSFVSNPFSARAHRSFQFCIPDEWYRRSKRRNVTNSSLQPSESTIKQLVALQESDDTADEEGTARFQTAASHISSASAAVRPVSPDWRSSISQARLSSLFDVWKRPVSPTSPHRPGFIPEKKIVSEPRLVEHHSGSSLLTDDEVTEVDQRFDSADFEKMLVREAFNPCRVEILTKALG